MSLVGQDEAVRKIEDHFAECKRAREMLGEEEFVEEFHTIVEAVLTPECKRTPYMRAIMEEVGDVERTNEY